ncbi:Crp/Fnr family transcriptional regulator [Lacihabitans soyangensis]|uniref:Crp/Fnr family transcriptional regulator n=1 Tax=Lacihabitans soyangensis TaxID=869394 RepID=A0AAE3KVX7_9BACT|nr:Crp/Fnr family transcriptional regulator [Lacihabitans soyangensis]MCP9764721.1 Crp/Fnr family transcriptional regulator [Lacihabitans soyangensis]
MIKIPNLSLALKTQIETNSALVEIAAETEILREGQYIKVIPLVIEGLVKVFTKHEDKELLLYYIQPSESCVMSFTASLKNEPSKVFAITEENSKILLLPVDKVSHWIEEFPDLNNLFFQQYNLRYSDLLETINQLLFDKLDKRLMDYLKEKVKVTKKNPLKISHRQIANELGTAREVISRVMKKLEQESKVKQFSNSVEIL